MSDYKKKDFTTIQGAANRLGVKKRIVQEWVDEGRVETQNGLILLNIVEEIKPGNYVIYGSLPCDTNNITYLQLLKFANCFVDKNGYVIKNRWGDDDNIKK